MSDKLTTSEGQPIANNQNSQTAGKRGPLLIQDVHLLEKLAHFNRERIPERVVHAKGAGAFGEFVVTNDMSRFTKAGLFNGVGKKTRVAIRFSQVAGESGYIDTYRDVRGFAVKFYSEDGNYDIVGNNTPVFFVNDPLKFPDFIHSQKRDPKTHLRDPYMQWDFWAHSPETLHQVTILMADRGIPASYRMMHGYGSHTYKWVNDLGEVFWIKYHFRTNQGVKNLTDEAAAQIASENTDYLMDELFSAIEAGDYPSWTLSVQIIPYEVGLEYKYDLFDVTKVVSQKDYPLIEVGVLTLNENPQNYFTDVEEIAFSPANLVPGIEVSPDKLLQGRLFAYKDAARYRLGVNYDQLPVNKPINKVNNYERDGFMQSANFGGKVNYEPNSQGGPTQDPTAAITPFEVEGQVDTYEYEADHYSQAGDLYRLLSEEEKVRLVQTIKASLGQVSDRAIQILEIQQFYLADKDYGTRIADALDIPLTEIQLKE